MISIEVSAQCQGHGVCYLNHPDLFEPNDQSFSEPIATVVSDEHAVDLRRAIASCPNMAISMHPVTVPNTGTEGGR
ncbi:ferredoxin [Gordonia humi]|uniref:ferredoxin n=1 Tax=Gordonia humi TaxID=686429 RepID=UPI00160F890B